MPLRPFVVLVTLYTLANAAVAQERQWSLNAGDQDAYLIFGVVDSDDVGISLWCPIRQGTVNIFVPEPAESLPANQEVTVTLVAGDTAADVKGKTEVNEDAGVSSVEAIIEADNPFFDAVLKSDRLRVKVGKEESVFPLVEADVAGLLALCRKN
jgi:hypothetical protein